MNGSGKDRISGLLTSRIMELLLIAWGLPLHYPGRLKPEEEKQIGSIVEEFKFNSLELQITDEDGKHSNSVKQDGVKVLQNTD